MNKAEAGSVGKFFSTVLVLLLLLGMAAVVLYLLSERNQRRYRLSSADGVVLVERGRFFPLGFEVYEPQAPALRNAYAPISLPPNLAFGPAEEFDDRSDLDRALFATLAGWARERLDSTNPDEFELAITYVERAELLPGISEEQRKELRTLRGNAAYRRGHLLLADVVERLEQAKAEFEMSVRLGASHAGDAQTWVRDIENKIRALTREPGGRHAHPGASPEHTPNPVEPQQQPPPLPKNAPEEPAPEPWRL